MIRNFCNILGMPKKRLSYKVIKYGILYIRTNLNKRKNSQIFRRKTFPAFLIGTQKVA